MWKILRTMDSFSNELKHFKIFNFVGPSLEGRDSLLVDKHSHTETKSWLGHLGVIEANDQVNLFSLRLRAGAASRQ